MKIKIAVILAMLLFCLTSNHSVSVEAGTTRTVDVHAKIWTIHGVYTKSNTSKSANVKNYSGYGEYGYCYGQIRSDLSGQWTAYTTNYKLYKNDSFKTMYFSNTIDKGKNVSLRLIGADTQTGDDKNRVTFEY